jgi:hypothetical protein
VSFAPPLGVTILAHLGKMQIINKNTEIITASFFKRGYVLVIFSISKVINLYNPKNNVQKKGYLVYQK